MATSWPLALHECIDHFGGERQPLSRVPERCFCAETFRVITSIMPKAAWSALVTVQRGGGNVWQRSPWRRDQSFCCMDGKGWDSGSLALWITLSQSIDPAKSIAKSRQWVKLEIQKWEFFTVSQARTLKMVEKRRQLAAIPAIQATLKGLSVVAQTLLRARPSPLLFVFMMLSGGQSRTKAMPRFLFSFQKSYHLPSQANIRWIEDWFIFRVHFLVQNHFSWTLD